MENLWLEKNKLIVAAIEAHTKALDSWLVFRNGWDNPGNNAEYHQAKIIELQAELEKSLEISINKPDH